MSGPVDLSTMALGHRLEGPFLVLDVSERVPESGNAFVVLTIGNHTGRIETEPFWLERQQEIAGVRPGHVVQVIGEVGQYRDRQQVRVRSIRALPAGTIDVSDLLPSVGAVDKFWDTLDGWRREIAKPRLARVVGLFFDDPSFRADFERCPASVGGHHAQIGGLLKHTTEVAAVARTIARTSGADIDVVVAGALLHDIGKLDAYRWDGPFVMTDAGRLMGHVVLGAVRLARRLAEESDPPCTDAERDLLLHLVLSHHGRREFGSPVPPLTLEAEALHWADNASAKTASVAEILADARRFKPDSDFAEPHWTVDRRRLYRGRLDWGTDSENK